VTVGPRRTTAKFRPEIERSTAQEAKTPAGRRLGFGVLNAFGGTRSKREKKKVCVLAFFFMR
jgi:hypothetical protein